MKDVGVFICISHGEPSERLPFFEHYDLDDLFSFTPWFIEVKPIGIHFKFYFYCMSKQKIITIVAFCRKATRA